MQVVLHTEKPPHGQAHLLSLTDKNLNSFYIVFRDNNNELLILPT